MPETRIHRDMPLPDIVSRYPAARSVLDRYGLHGCGGPLGPREPLWFFARAHRVDEARLLAELEQAAAGGQPVSVEYRPGPGDTIYRRFFKAGIATMFTAGCVLGGINLAIMAARRELAGLDMRAVTWAHAHAQVAGWVTFFVMGFAYQSVPRFKFTTLWRPRLASRSLFVMAAALTVRTVADLWAAHPFWSAAGRAAGAVELAVVGTFALVIWKTLRSSRNPAEPWERFLLGAVGWMLAAFAFDLWMFSATGHARDRQGWIGFIGQYDAPWRDLQLLGYAGGMILAVSQRFLPFIYGFREIGARTARNVFWLWNGSVAVSIAAYAALFATRRPVWGVLLELSILGLLASVLIFIRGFGLFSQKVEPDRSLAFLRAAWAWAVVAFVMLALLPAYDALRGVAFSHAYFGGYRHAFTVGFISMMIVGVSAKVVPVLCGIDASRVSGLRAAFWLINTGSAMRVVFQVLTDWQPWAFPVMAASAWVEIAGLGLWAADLLRAMAMQPEAVVCGSGEIGPQTRVAEVLERYPQTEPVFLRFGFHLINNPVARRVFARSVTLEQACRLKHVRFEEFHAALRQASEMVQITRTPS